MIESTFEGRPVKLATVYPYKSDRLWDKEFRRTKPSEYIDKELLSHFGEESCNDIIEFIGNDHGFITMVKFNDDVDQSKMESFAFMTITTVSHIGIPNKTGVFDISVSANTKNVPDIFVAIENSVADSFVENLDWVYSKRDFREYVNETISDILDKNENDFLGLTIVASVSSSKESVPPHLIVSVNRFSKLEKQMEESLFIVGVEDCTTSVGVPKFFIVPSAEYQHVLSDWEFEKVAMGVKSISVVFDSGRNRPWSNIDMYGLLFVPEKSSTIEHLRVVLGEQNEHVKSLLKRHEAKLVQFTGSYDGSS